MKILFVYPDVYSVFSRHYNVGIGSLSAVLKKNGHITKLAYIKHESEISDLLNEINNWSPQIIGFSATTAMSGVVKDISLRIKNSFPDIYQICGGIHPTLCPEFLEGTVSLDAICRGEGELALLDFINRFSSKGDFVSTENFWFRANGSIIRNRLRPLISNLDELPFPDRDIFDYALIAKERGEGLGRVGEFLFMRGCRFDCSFCSNHAQRNLYIGQAYVRWPSTEWAIAQIQEVINAYSIDIVFIHDDEIVFNKEWLYKFLNSYKQHIKLPFWVNLRIGTFGEDDVKLFKEAGCARAIIGIESGQEKIRRDVLNRKMSNSQIITGFKIFEKYGVQTTSQNMVGLPYETPRDFLETIRLNAALIPNMAGIGVFQPYPGTRLAKLCEDNHWVISRKANFRERTDTVLALPTFKRKHILFYYRHFDMLIMRMRRAENDRKAVFERAIPMLPSFFGLIFLHEGLLRIFNYVRKLAKGRK